MTELVVTRGLPGCGKSTWAKAWVAKDVAHRARVERDQLRAMMHDSVWKGQDTENQIRLVQEQAIISLLRSGVSVVVSDTNLIPHVFDSLKNLAQAEGVTLVVKDFRNVPLETVLKQNAQRTGKEFIPEDVIQKMYDKHIKHLPKPKVHRPDFSKMTKRERFEYRYPDFEG